MRELMASDAFTARLDDGIAHVELCRPERLNQIDSVLHEELVQLLELITDDLEVRVMLLSSTGRAFSAGGDMHVMRELNADPVKARKMFTDASRLVGALLRLRVPLVCAVQGPAMGLASNIVFSADAVVAAPEATFADPHVRIGLVAGDGGVVAWPNAGGYLRAKRHLLTGDPLNAADAFAAGMVTDLVASQDELLPAATALARRLADLPPLAVQGTKRALNHALAQRAGEAFDLGLMLELDTMRSEDVLEAISAFMERRPGRYQGR
jgi:enoyl-CoA hydratase